MTEAAPVFPVIREAVGSFPDREHFRNGVAALLAVGFERADLSVLASHDSLAVAEGVDSPKEILRAGLSDEIKYIAPLTVADRRSDRRARRRRSRRCRVEGFL